MSQRMKSLFSAPILALALAGSLQRSRMLATGRQSSRQMKDLQVWRREKDGTWMFIRGMHFRIPPRRLRRSRQRERIDSLEEEK